MSSSQSAGVVKHYFIYNTLLAIQTPDLMQNDVQLGLDYFSYYFLMNKFSYNFMNLFFIYVSLQRLY